jgi:hypothetical protein
MNYVDRVVRIGNTYFCDYVVEASVNSGRSGWGSLGYCGKIAIQHYLQKGGPSSGYALTVHRCENHKNDYLPYKIYDEVSLQEIIVAEIMYS